MSDSKRHIDPAGNEVTLAPVGQQVVFENDHVRVWDIVLDPDEAQPWHQHEHPYLVVALQGSDNRIESIDGQTVRHVTEETGGVVYREPGEVHMLTNEGDARYVSRLVEFKR